MLTPLRDEDPELASRLRGRLRAVQDRVGSDDADAFGTFLDSEVFPLLDDAVAAVVPDDVRDTTAFHAQVLNALAGRLTEEYSAAVTDDGEIELAGEYWDGRGFYHRVTERYEGFRSELDSETRELVDPELDRLGGELRTAVPPWDVANSIAPLTDDFGRAVEA